MASRPCTVADSPEDSSTCPASFATSSLPSNTVKFARSFAKAMYTSVPSTDALTNGVITRKPLRERVMKCSAPRHNCAQMLTLSLASTRVTKEFWSNWTVMSALYWTLARLFGPTRMLSFRHSASFSCARCQVDERRSCSSTKPCTEAMRAMGSAQRADGEISACCVFGAAGGCCARAAPESAASKFAASAIAALHQPPALAPNLILQGSTSETPLAYSCLPRVANEAACRQRGFTPLTAALYAMPRLVHPPWGRGLRRGRRRAATSSDGRKSTRREAVWDLPDVAYRSSRGVIGGAGSYGGESAA
jgi:hypothetical protein